MLIYVTSWKNYLATNKIIQQLPNDKGLWLLIAKLYFWSGWLCFFIFTATETDQKSSTLRGTGAILINWVVIESESHICYTPTYFESLFVLLLVIVAYSSAQNILFQRTWLLSKPNNLKKCPKVSIHYINTQYFEEVLQACSSACGSAEVLRKPRFL